MRFLKPSLHGVLDYLAASVMALSPFFFGFSGLVAWLLWAVAAFHLTYSLMTAYSWGIVKWLPFTSHAGIELAEALLLLASPWLFGFSGETAGRNVFLVLSTLLLGASVCTDYQVAELSGREFSKACGEESLAAESQSRHRQGPIDENIFPSPRSR